MDQIFLYFVYQKNLQYSHRHKLDLGEGGLHLLQLRPRAVARRATAIPPPNAHHTWWAAWEPPSAHGLCIRLCRPAGGSSSSVSRKEMSNKGQKHCQTSKGERERGAFISLCPCWRAGKQSSLSREWCCHRLVVAAVTLELFPFCLGTSNLLASLGMPTSCFHFHCACRGKKSW